MGAITKQVIVVRTDLNMRKGKIGAQVAHASLGALLTTKDPISAGLYPNSYNIVMRISGVVKEWLENSFTKICVGIDSEEELLALYEEVQKTGMLCKLIKDNGTTEFGGVPTYTCLAIGPDYSEKIDPFTGSLKLL